MIARKLLQESINEEGSNIYDNIVLDSPDKLEQALSKCKPQRSWRTHFGFVNDVVSSSMIKSNANRWKGNDEYGRKLNDPRINAYLDSDDYKRSGEQQIGKNGKPLKTPFSPKNPMEGCLFVLYDVDIQWDLQGYGDTQLKRRSITNKYLDKPYRLNKHIQTQDYKDHLAKYVKDNELSQSEINHLATNPSSEEAKMIMNYVAKKDTNAGGGWEKDDYTFFSKRVNKDGSETTALRVFTPYPIKMTPTYYYYKDGKVEKVSTEFVNFWKREFSSAPSTKVDSDLTKILTRTSNFNFRNFPIKKIAYMTFTGVEKGTKDHVKLTYVNKSLDVEDLAYEELNKKIIDYSSSKIDNKITPYTPKETPVDVNYAKKGKDDQLYINWDALENVKESKKHKNMKLTEEQFIQLISESVKILVEEELNKKTLEEGERWNDFKEKTKRGLKNGLIGAGIAGALYGLGQKMADDEDSVNDAEEYYQQTDGYYNENKPDEIPLYSESRLNNIVKKTLRESLRRRNLI